MQRRNEGLDFLRATALFLVICHHSIYFYTPYLPKLTTLEVLGQGPGVAFFFALSGYLVGQGIIRKILPGISLAKIKDFYIKRWIRIFPLYFIVLIGLVLLDNIHSSRFHLHPYHFLLLQGFAGDEWFWFPIAWFISVMEWFYILLLPVLFVFFRKGFSNKMLVFFLILGIVFTVCIPVIFKDSVFASRVPYRFNQILFGVLLASIKVWNESFYKRLNITFWGGMAGILIATSYLLYLKFYNVTFIRYNFLLGPFLSLSTILIIPRLEIMRFNEKMANAIGHICAYSYPIFLVHFNVFLYFKQFNSSLFQATLFFGVALYLAIKVSIYAHKFVELPSIAWRKKKEETYPRELAKAG